MYKGLTAAEATRLLQTHGYNELPAVAQKSFWKFLIETLKEPMIALLVLAGLFYLFLGDKIEAGLLLASIMVIVSISLYQERKAERSLQALARLASPRAVVIRDGLTQRIAGREVVVGDTVIVSPGDRIPADITLIESVNLQVNESMLTGESQAVLKNTTDNNWLFSGTIVTLGHGVGMVQYTGINTEFGKIGKSLGSIEIEKTLLQQEVKTFVKWIATIGFGLCVLLGVISLFSGKNLIESALAGLTLAIGIIPEELPIVLLLFMTMGAWRLAKNNILTRRSATIETLGAATVLCVDKTGTITKNEMSLEDMIYAKSNKSIEEQSSEILKYSTLASPKSPVDPTELAIIDRARKQINLDELYERYHPVKEYPLEEQFFNVAIAYENHQGGFEIALKGSPESVLALCSTSNKQSMLKQAHLMAESGLRVLGVAKAHLDTPTLPKHRTDIEYEFLGLIGLKDPVREGVRESVQSAYRAGIRVMMLTGDYKGTALDIASQIGLETDGVLTGDELEQLSGKELKFALKKVNVFSRVRPAHKLLIIKELKKMGEIVAMTGDGVNDGPALKAAHIGVAMGQRGTDVAREASAIVLMDDNFNSIVSGIKMGRRIYDNLQKSIHYLIAVHLPMIILAILPVTLGYPLILMPVHIVFLEFIIDPSSTFVFEADKEDKDIMDRSPRKLSERIIAIRNLAWPIIYGTLVSLILFIAYIWVLPDLGETMARTYVFTLLVTMTLVTLLSNLSHKENLLSKLWGNDNKALIMVSLFTVIVMYLATHTPVVQEIFKFSPLEHHHWVEIFVIAIVALVTVELFKSLKRFISK